MNNQSASHKVYDWYGNLSADIRRSSRIIAEIKEKIKMETDSDALRSLEFLLAQEYSAHGRHADAEAVYLELYRQRQDEPLPLISLAEKKLYYEDSPVDALPLIDRAVNLSMQSGVFRRLALGVKARIALELKAYGVVEDVLRQLMQLKFARGNVDCGIERDFFDRLPAGTIDEQVARDYDNFSRLAK